MNTNKSHLLFARNSFKSIKDFNTHLQELKKVDAKFLFIQLLKINVANTLGISTKELNNIVVIDSGIIFITLPNAKIIITRNETKPLLVASYIGSTYKGRYFENYASALVYIKANLQSIEA